MFRFIPTSRFSYNSSVPVLLQKEILTKLTLFILDSSISSELFLLEVQ